MAYKELNDGYIIKYKFSATVNEGSEEMSVSRTTTNYAETPIYGSIKELNERLAELDKRQDIIEIYVTKVKYKEEWLNQINS